MFYTGLRIKVAAELQISGRRKPSDYKVLIDKFVNQIPFGTT
jgi:hypothetical protein